MTTSTIRNDGRPMKQARSLAIVGLVLLAVSASTVSAQVKPPHTRPRAPGPTAEGKWSVTVSLNVSNDTPTVTAALAADAPIRGWPQAAVPTLVVRCQTPRDQDETVLLSTRGLPVQPGLDVYLVVADRRMSTTAMVCTPSACVSTRTPRSNGRPSNRLTRRRSSSRPSTRRRWSGS